MKSFKSYITESKNFKGIVTRLNEKTVACGQCFPWAYRQAVDNDTILYHGIVHDPFTGKSYDHAWIEEKGKVKDWQTMELGTSKYAKKGWPKKDFYKAFRPEKIKKYNKLDTLLNAAKTKHYGPW